MTYKFLVFTEFEISVFLILSSDFTIKFFLQISMNVHQARVKMEELVLTASIRTVVIAMLGIQETTVKLILTNAHQVLVKTVEPAQMVSIHILVIAFPGMPETTVK